MILLIVLGLVQAAAATWAFRISTHPPTARDAHFKGFSAMTTLGLLLTIAAGFSNHRSQERSDASLDAIQRQLIEERVLLSESREKQAQMVGQLQGLAMSIEQIKGGTQSGNTSTETGTNVSNLDPVTKMILMTIAGIALQGKPSEQTPQNQGVDRTVTNGTATHP